jgi:hypothetical protein
MRLTVASGLGVTCGYCHGAPGVLFRLHRVRRAPDGTHGARDEDPLGVLELDIREHPEGVDVAFQAFTGRAP